MFRCLLIPFLFFQCVALFGQDEKNIALEDLIEKDRLMYESDSDIPYTGKCYQNHPGGKLGMGGIYKNGKKHGDWVWWYKNGEKQRITHFENGKKDGKCIWWYKNGVKKSEIIFSENKNIRQLSWDKDGKKTTNPSFSSFR